ncbi:hypothetical protein D7V31_16415 [Acinetobacter sp. WCHAc060007]|nr:hypothetical protein D7V31_16415 [Acinetobacter sp. WCHAc060007]
MVGLVISMLCLIALLTLFKAIVTTSVDSQQNAQQDTQLFNGLTLAQMLAQNAGFGFSSGTNVLIPSSTLALDNNISVESQKAVLWRYYTTINTPNTLTCQGIASVLNNNQTKLILLKANSCAQTSNLDNLTWTVDRVLAILPSASTISFNLTTQTCTPYGIGTAASHSKLTITANTFSFPVCLSNITS